MSQQETPAQRATREALQRRFGMTDDGGGLYQTDEFPQGVLSPNFLEGMGGNTPPEPTASTSFNQGSIADPTAMQMQGLPDADVNVPEKKLGFLGRIKQQPGGQQALLAFGSAMLRNQDFFQGLGEGSMAYQNTLDAAKDDLKPKLTKDQQFQYTLDPKTGEPTFKRTAVGDYDYEMEQTKLENLLARVGLTQDGSTLRNRETIKYNTWETEQDNDNASDIADNKNRTSIQVAEISAEASRLKAEMAQAATSAKPPPVGAMKMFNEAQSSANKAQGTITDGNKILGYMADGTLDLGIINNLLSKGAMATGIGANANTRAYGELEQFTQTLVNTILIDARGVQTDGDAARAKIMSLVSSGDTTGAHREISNVMRMIERGRQQNVSTARTVAGTYGIAQQPASAAPRAAPKPNKTSTKVGWKIVG
jgi:hypothetical protein